MKRNTRKIISISILVSLIVTSNSFISAAEVIGTMSSESVIKEENISTPSDAVRSEEIEDKEVSEIPPTKATPSKAIPSNLTPSNATPSNATPSNATPSNATPSNATPIEKVEFKYVRPDKEDIPDYYKKVYSNKIFYTFIDRNNIEQYRIFGYYEDSSITDWYECNEKGEVDTSCQFIDIEWEYYNQAPYIYESKEVTEDEWQKLYDMGYGDWCESEIIKPKKNSNYNLANIEIWHLYPNKFCPYTVTYDYDSNYFMFGHIVNNINSEEKWFKINSNDWSITELKDYGDRNVNKLSTSEFEAENSSTIVSNLSRNNININKLKLSKSKNSTAILTASQSKAVTVYGCLKSTSSASDREATVYMNNGDDGIIQFFAELHPGTNAVLLIVQNSTNRLVGYSWNSKGPAMYRFNYDGSQAGDYSCYSVLPNYNDEYSRLNELLRKKGITSDIEYSWRGLIPDICIDYQATAHVKSGTTTVNYSGNGADWGYTAPTSHNYTMATSISGNAFGRRYYTFKNWNTDPSGNGTTYWAGQTVTELPYANMTLYAQWNRSSSLVTFKNWDGATIESQEVALNGTAIAPNETRLFKNGYSFSGWSRGLSGITDHTTITANYRANTYTVVYNSNGATGGSTAASSHSYDSVKKLTTNGFTNKYYSFKNWNTKSDGTGTSYSNEQMIMNLSSIDGATITLYAQWDRSSSLVIFEDWDGNTLKEQVVNIGGTAVAPDPKRNGYTFLGWDKSLSNISDHTIITAQYIINYYNFQLLGNGGTVYGNSSKESTVAYNTSFDQLLLNGKIHASRVGYTFLNWYTHSTGGSIYSYSGNTMPASDLEIYAQWEPNIYEVSFDSNHVRWDGGIHKEYHTYDTELGGLPVPDINGWNFAGWWTEKNGAGEQINESSMVEAHDVTYYGYWTPKTYQIHFDKNLYAIDGNPEDKTVTYDSYLGELPVLSTEGYTFLGWYTEPEDGEKVDDETPVAIGDQTYYAHWKNKSFSISLITENAINIMKNVIVIYDLKIGELPIPKLEDFKFRGWYQQPYSANNATPSEAIIDLQERIFQDTATPSEALKIDENTVYKTATGSAAYAYFDLVFREEPGNRNRRCGIDGEMDTDDDNFYFNGQDGVAGSSDDCKIEPGEDKIYGTVDDYYLYKGYRVYPGPGNVFGDLDDFMDLENGTNLRPGTSTKWVDEENLLVNNGYDKKPSTRDDWIWENKELNTIRKSGPDGIFFTDDDELWWIGMDEMPGTEDDKFIHKGIDGQYGTIDDYIDNGDGTNTRPGPDLIWGTEDDQIWLNGPDDIPGNEDDKLKVDEKNSIGNTPITQQATVLPMYPLIVNINNNDKGDDDGITYKDILPQASALKQSNYEGLGGDGLEDIDTSLPEESIATFKVAETASPLNVKVEGDNNKSFWSELLNWISEIFSWIKENKKDVLAVLLLFLILLAVLYEGSRRKNKGKMPIRIKCHKIIHSKTKLNDSNVFKKRLYNNRN